MARNQTSLDVLRCVASAILARQAFIAAAMSTRAQA